MGIAAKCQMCGGTEQTCRCQSSKRDVVTEARETLALFRTLDTFEPGA
jgi:hypothetical protein